MPVKRHTCKHISVFSSTLAQKPSSVFPASMLIHINPRAPIWPACDRAALGAKTLSDRYLITPTPAHSFTPCTRMFWNPPRARLAPRVLEKSHKSCDWDRFPHIFVCLISFITKSLLQIEYSAKKEEFLRTSTSMHWYSGLVYVPVVWF